MADRKIAYATAASITITLASLAQAAARECTAIDNGTNKYTDSALYLAMKLQTGTPASDKAIYIHGYGSHDGTNYGDNATGSDAAVTLRVPHNFVTLKAVSTPDSGGLTYKAFIPSVALAFGRRLPKKWGVVVENKTNITFSATEGDHTKEYTGIYETVG